MWLVKHRLAKSEKKGPLPWIKKSAKEKMGRERTWQHYRGPAKPRPITKCRDKSHTSQGGCELISTSESGRGEEKVRGGGVGNSRKKERTQERRSQRVLLQRTCEDPYFHARTQRGARHGLRTAVAHYNDPSLHTQISGITPSILLTDHTSCPSRPLPLPLPSPHTLELEADSRTNAQLPLTPAHTTNDMPGAECTISITKGWAYFLHPQTNTTREG